MSFFEKLNAIIKAYNLADIVTVVAGILGGLAAVVEIFLRIKGYMQKSKGVIRQSQTKEGLKILELFRKKNVYNLSSNNDVTNEIQPKPSNRKTAKIFISFKSGSHPDEELAWIIHKGMEKRGHKPFIHTMLPLGVEWAKALQKQLENSDYLIVLLSEASIKSEMVLEEVTFAEIHRMKFQYPQLLPVRVQYLKMLPYGLANHLDSKQFAMWRDEKDSADLISRIISTVEMDGAELPFETAKLEEDEGDKNKPLPSFDPRILEIPTGAVKLQSPYYIRRDCDEKMEHQMKDGGSTTTIRAGRQMGKTSLLVRAANFAKGQGHRIVYIDFQQIKPEFRNSLDNLLRYFADEITFRLRLDEAQLEKIWNTSRGSPDKFGQFMEATVLHEGQPLLLAMDEADQLMDAGYKTDFFALVRAWDSRRAFDAAWEKLSLAMVISSHPHLLIDDYRQSPFNVGLRIQVEDFDNAQVEKLNELHGKLLNPNEIHDMMDLLGGHPYLTRQAFYTLLSERFTWTELSTSATGEQSPFSSHLHFYLWQLRDRAELVSAMKEVILKHTCSDEIVLYRLVAAGLVKEQADNTCVARCGLYENYFRKTLNV